MNSLILAFEFEIGFRTLLAIIIICLFAIAYKAVGLAWSVPGYDYDEDHDAEDTNGLSKRFE